MRVRFTRDWHRPKAQQGDELELAEDAALRLLKQGVVEAVPQERERAVTLEVHKAVLG